MNAKRLAMLLLGLGLVPLVGCGGGTAEVSGTVTVRNQPLANGVVTFFPEKGDPVAGFVENGAYTIPSVPYGTSRVAVAPQPEGMTVTTGKSGRTLKPGEVDPTAKGAQPKKSSGSTFPEKYKSADTSGLTCQVDKSKVTFPIALD
jgi:hypothetical protein